MSLLSRLSLKRRIALYSALLGIGLSVVFAWAAWWITEDHELLIIGVLVEAEVEGARAALAAGESPRLSGGARLRGWHLRPGQALPADMPTVLADLADGVHEDIPGQGAGMHASVVSIGNDRLIHLMDLGSVEVEESYLILSSFLVVLLGGLVSALAGRWLAARALAPLTRLAEDIEALPSPPATRTLSPGLHDPLLRRVGQSLDSYQQRLAAAEHARERFFADASHELRSPLASLRGAAEVLLDEADTPPAMRRRLERIDRAADELGQLLDGLLLSARGTPASGPGCTLGDALAQSIARLQARANARGVRLAPATGLPGPELALPAAWVEVLLLNLVRSVIDHPGVAAIEFSITGPRLAIDVAGIDAADWQERSDRGFGIRLARSLGERLAVVVEAVPTGLVLDFNAALSPTD
jgi:signal transduction histidine kinase